jgi:transcriptional regulator with XRE-family HTH domain
MVEFLPHVSQDCESRMRSGVRRQEEACVTTAAGKSLKPRRVRPSGNGRSAWRRERDDLGATGKLGQRLRELREQRALTLSAASAATGLPPATLSRIENNKMSPTFSVLLRLMQGLGLTWADVMAPLGTAAPDRQASFARAGEGFVMEVPGVRYTALHSDARHLMMTVNLADLSPDVPSEIGRPMGHAGNEFCYVLEGELELTVEGSPPRRLRPGDSALFDSTLPHGYAAQGGKPARLLIVSAHDPHAPVVRDREPARVRRAAAATRRGRSAQHD